MGGFSVQFALCKYATGINTSLEMSMGEGLSQQVLTHSDLLLPNIFALSEQKLCSGMSA